MNRIINTLLLLIVTLGLSQAQSTFTQPKDSVLNGRWKVELKKAKLNSVDNAQWTKLWGDFPKEIIITIDSIGLSSLPNHETFELSFDKIKADKKRFSFSYLAISENDKFFGRAKLESISEDKLKGNYIFLTEWGEIIATVEMNRLWCCGNHNPRHCKPDLKQDCKDVSRDH